MKMDGEAKDTRRSDGIFSEDWRDGRQDTREESFERRVECLGQDGRKTEG